MLYEIGDRRIRSDRHLDDLGWSFGPIAECPNELRDRRLGDAARVDEASGHRLHEPTANAPPGMQFDFDLSESSGGLRIARHGHGVVDDFREQLSVGPADFDRPPDGGESGDGRQILRTCRRGDELGRRSRDLVRRSREIDLVAVQRQAVTVCRKFHCPCGSRPAAAIAQRDARPRQPQIGRVVVDGVEMYFGDLRYDRVLRDAVEVGHAELRRRDQLGFPFDMPRSRGIHVVTICIPRRRCAATAPG